MVPLRKKVLKYGTPKPSLGLFFRAEGVRVRFQALSRPGFKVFRAFSGFGFRVQGLGFRVSGLGFRVC